MTKVHRRMLMGGIFEAIILDKPKTWCWQHTTHPYQQCGIQVDSLTLAPLSIDGVGDFIQRRSAEKNRIQVFACDYSTAKFPHVDKPDVNKVALHDVTEPIPR